MKYIDIEFSFKLAIVLAVTIVCCTAIRSCTEEDINRREAMIKMVQAGHDPITVGCSFGFNSTEAPLCTALAYKDKK